MKSLDVQILRKLISEPTTLDPQAVGELVERRFGLVLYWRPPLDDAQFLFQMCLEQTLDGSRTDCVFSAYGNLVLVQPPLWFATIEEELKQLLELNGWTVVPEEVLDWKIFLDPTATVFDAFFSYS